MIEALWPIAEMTVDVEGYVAERRLCERRRVVTIVVVFAIEGGRCRLGYGVGLCRNL